LLCGAAPPTALSCHPGNARLVAFLSTPHSGAALGAVVKFFIPRLASTHVELLSNSGGFLTNLNQSYRELVVLQNIATISYYEKYKTKNAFLVVSEESADPGVSGTRPIAVDADHITICKPVSRSSVTRRPDDNVSDLLS
jgi:hypothetical protein